MKINNPKIALLLIAGLISNILSAQDLSYSKPGSTYYPDLPDPVKTNKQEWSKVRKAINVSFASDNVRYPKEKVPLASPIYLWAEKAWKGERVHTQILVWSKTDTKNSVFR